eukprot:9361948-Pyramimonas_sp.AAC.1
MLEASGAVLDAVTHKTSHMRRTYVFQREWGVFLPVGALLEGLLRLSWGFFAAFEASGGHLECLGAVFRRLGASWAM